ncbi:DddA-like double-stranded DNA deaminase toxin [Actinoplanes sp. NPDC026619]|uniref:DddA-like double-stranded DNA deaminase toxin n=1 Tax=Actinoplanes sp. NPDC026619 TaxID=3155798 RepID=UPI0033FBFFF2
MATVGFGATPSHAEAPAAESPSTSLAEDFRYPGQATVNDVKLLSGDGNIMQATCATGLISVRVSAATNGEVCFRVLALPGNVTIQVPSLTEIRGDGHDLVALIKPAGSLPSSIHVTAATSTPVVGATGDTTLVLNAATPSTVAKPTIRWPNWDVNNLPDRGWFAMTNWSQIPHSYSGEEEREWSCQMGAELHHGGPRSQALAASALLQPSGDPEDLSDDFEAARDMDTADYPLTDEKRAPQEAAWIAQLATLSGAGNIPPSFGYPSDDFLWEHVNFDRVFDIVPEATDATTAKVKEMVAAKVKTDPFLIAYAAYMDHVFQAFGAPPGYGEIGATEALASISADDARRFLQYGGFPMTAPVKGTPEFRVAVEEIKARWASCDITNPQDPYSVLTEVVATAQTEWNAERDAQAGERKTIVSAHMSAWTAMRGANEAMIESVGQAWVAERALVWQKNRLANGTPLTTAEQTALNAVIKGAQDKISAQITKANQYVATATAAGTSADNAQTAANAKATAAGYPAGRGLTYAHQSVQVTKALIGAATSSAAASNTALQASKTTGSTSEALWAQSQAEMFAVQAKFRRQAAEYAQYEAHQAALAAAGEAQKASDAADRAHQDRLDAEAAEAVAKTKAADAHAKMLVAQSERDNAAAKRAEADKQRNNAAAAQTRAEQQRDIAVAKRNTAQTEAGVASRKRQDAEQSERYATDQRNIAINAAIAGNTLEQQAATAEAYADADDSQDDAADARAAATAARAAANAATSAAGRAQSAANEATAAAVLARKAATESQAAADRANAAADAAEADAAATASQLRIAQAAAADAISASKEAAAAVTAAQQQATIAAAKAQEARDQAAAARSAADLSLGASADALGRATAASDQAAATRDAALRTYAAADETVSMGTPFAQTDTSAGMAVLVGMDAKSIAEQQTAAADAKAAEAARAAQAAHAAAAQADADAKAAAEAAAAAADDAVAAQNSVKAAAASAKRAAQEASLAAASVARTAQYNANAQADAATAARFAAEADSEAQAAWDAADEAERDAAAAHVAADQASAAAADARAAADQAERDATAAEAAAQRALEAAQDAQNAAALAEQNADAQARDALAVSSPAGEAGVQAIPHVEPQVISQTPITCVPFGFCETKVTFRMVGTMDLVLVTCPDLSQTSCPGQESKDLLSTIAINDPPQTRTVQLDRNDVLDILGHVVTSLISDYITCFKGVTVNDGKIDGSQAKDWAIACAWVVADWVLPAVVGKVAKAIKAMRIAMRTGVGFGEAYEALRASGISATAITKIESEMYEAVVRLCGGHSFAADTPVVLASGGTRPISEVAAGDLVRATDPVTGHKADERVTERFVTQDTELTDVTVRNAAGRTGVLHTTPHHPFWAGAWVDAEDLAKGDQLTGDVTVESVHTYPGAATMYDLTVDELHTYFVEAAGADVLVHNVSCPLWVTRALTALKSKRITTGQMFDDSGNQLFVEMTSGADSSTPLIDDFLAKSPDISGGPFSAAKDTETKFAWWMRLYKGDGKVDVVINNPKGPCKPPNGCQTLVPTILKPGQEMHVWYPNATEPVVLKGRSTVP